MDEQSDPRFLVGQVLAERYWLQEHLGRGAMGDVFRARHAKVPRTFAVKVLHPELVADPKVCQRFEREAELAGRLHHRNVISVIDVGETARSRYLVMEFAEGVSLVDVIAGQAMSATRVIGLAKQICDGLQHAHEMELVHRDLKPENIIVERTGNDEVPRIVDFGLAILRDGATPEDVDRLTTRGIVLGTPHYLAPETALGAPVDHRIDLFALGVILYEMMTGVMPYDGDGVDVARANLHLATPAMGVRVPGLVVDPLLEALVGKLLEKNPNDRPQTAREVHTLLEMIEKDRKHAALVLGVTAPIAVPMPDANVTPIREPRATGNGVPLERVSSVERTVKTEDPDAAGSAESEWYDEDRHDERKVTTDRVSQREVQSTDAMIAMSRSRRRGAVAALAAIALLALVLFLALRGNGTTDATRAPVAMHVVAPETPAPPPPAPVTPTPVDVAVATPPISVETTHVVHVPQARSTKPAQPQTIMAAVPPRTDEATPPPAADVIDMYQKIGRRLKAIADRRDMAADDLWVRYRLVRINDVYASNAKRANAVSILSGIEGELKSRFPDR